MRNAGGYACVSDPESGIIERDTFTCFHCNTVVHVKPKMAMDDLGSMCRNCMKMVCAKCAAGQCVPFMKRLEAMERRDEVLRSYGM